MMYHYTIFTAMYCRKGYKIWVYVAIVPPYLTPPGSALFFAILPRVPLRFTRGYSYL